MLIAPQLMQMQVECSASSNFSWPHFEMENSAVTEWALVCTEQYKVHEGGGQVPQLIPQRDGEPDKVQEGGGRGGVQLITL